MGDLGDSWREAREQRRDMRAKYEPINRKNVMYYAKARGLAITELNNGACIRVDGKDATVDIWPAGLKYHVISCFKSGLRNTRGLVPHRLPDLDTFLDTFFFSGGRP